jgi:hypothetical protein
MLNPFVTRRVLTLSVLLAATSLGACGGGSALPAKGSDGAAGKGADAAADGNGGADGLSKDVPNPGTDAIGDVTGGADSNNADANADTQTDLAPASDGGDGGAAGVGDGGQAALTRIEMSPPAATLAQGTNLSVSPPTTPTGPRATSARSACWFRARRPLRPSQGTA